MPNENNKTSMEREIIYQEIVEFCKNDEAADKAVDRILDLFSVSNCELLDKMTNEMQEVDDEYHFSIACKYLDDC